MPSLSGLLSPPPLGGGRLAPTLTGRDPYSLVKVLFVSDTMILWYQSISQGGFLIFFWCVGWCVGVSLFDTKVP